MNTALLAALLSLVAWLVLAVRNWLVAEERRTAREEARARWGSGAVA